MTTIEIDARDSKRAVEFIRSHIGAARGDAAGLTRVLDQMRNGELNAVRTMFALSELVIGILASVEGPDQVEAGLDRALAGLTAQADQLDAAEQATDEG
ncbi:hypothetical protein [Williamsia muralis]|uniref:Uncharacterized protein n=1 Tax=Williamsia marianensis TaxID=85044 RepID=A0ABU4EVV1_WILMA|nr:hypothetical protein [Williamsia muralis]MDV7135377.1 hypothetical protein [Williamsia muralis]